MKKYFILLVSILLVLSSCSYKSENSINFKLNGENILDAKAGIDTDNPDLAYIDFNTSKYKKMNFGMQNGEPISWYIITEEDDYYLLFSENVLEAMQYNKTNEVVDWDKSSLYHYLNNDFLKKYFTDDEKKRMVYTNDEDSDYVTMATIDNLVDLYGNVNYVDIDYYNNDDYYTTNKQIISKPTVTAIANGISVFDNKIFAEVLQEEIDDRYDFATGYSSYWLLNQTDDEKILYVTATGYLDVIEPNNKYVGVRPIIRIKK